MKKSLLTSVAAASVSFTLLATSSAQLATDDFSGTPYDDGVQYGDNGGSGFGPLTYLEGNNGGPFSATLDTRALGVFAGNAPGSSQALGRTLNSSFSSGTYTLSGRFDVDNAVAFTGFNIKSGLGASFGANELLSFGLTPGNGNTSIFVGGAANQSINLGTELRGQNLDFNLAFNTTNSTFTLGAKLRSSSTFSTVSGTLKDTNGAVAGTGSVAAIGVGNFNTGNGQNLVADNLNLIPEPTSLAMILGAGSFFLLRRRRA